MDGNMPTILINDLSSPTQTHPMIQTAISDVDSEHRSRGNDLWNTNTQLYENDENSPYTVIVASSLLSVPQIVVAVVTLLYKWQHYEDSSSLCLRIQLWVLVHCIRVTLSLSFEWVVYWAQNSQFQRVRDYHDRHTNLLKNVRFTLSLMELYWALMGNIWIFFSAGSSETDAHRCGDGSTTLHSVGFWLLIVPYVYALVPFLYCLISYGIVRLTGWDLDEYIEQRMSVKLERGATQEMINQLTLRIFAPTSLTYDPSCCICLCDFKLNEKIRLLPCDHHFHSDCVDEWLSLNATCPTCRITICKMTLSQQKKLASHRQHV
ncbi:hypothetical protein ABG067_002938 [Albugo candida]